MGKISSRIIFVIGIIMIFLSFTTNMYNLRSFINLYNSGAYDTMFYELITLTTLIIIICLVMYIPDLVSKSDGRGLLHSVFGIALFTMIAAIINIVIALYYMDTVFYIIKDILSLGIIFSITTHVISDLFTPYGSSLLHPITPVAVSLVKNIDGQEKFHKYLGRIGILLVLIAITV